MLWLESPLPREAIYKTAPREAPAATAMLAEALRPLQDAIAGNFYKMHAFRSDSLWRAFSEQSERELVTPEETHVEHLVRLKWLEEVGPDSDDNRGLRLTNLGSALLRDAERDSTQDEDVSVVLLGRDDPLAYPTLVGQLVQAGPGLLVDPYLELSHLHRIVMSTQLTRVLVSGHGRRQREVEPMRTYLESPSLSRHVEVRASTALHDRVLLSDSGDVVTLGTSLNGVGRKTTVLAPIPSPARDSLRREYEDLWREAEIVGPARAANEDSTESESDDNGEEGESPAE